MTTCNGEKFIAEQVESILKNLGQSDELLISDDSSIDLTIQIIKSFQDSRIKIFHHRPTAKTNRKRIIHNIEFVLEKASGDFIFLADQDDVWLENKVKITLPFLRQSDIVLSDCTVIDSSGQNIYPSFFHLNNSKIGFFNNLLKNSYIGCCMAFRKEILKIALPFPKNIPMHDYWIGMVGEVFFKVAMADEPLVKYRRHEFNLSSSGEKSIFKISTKLSFRIMILKALIRKIIFQNA